LLEAVILAFSFFGLYDCFGINGFYQGKDEGFAGLGYVHFALMQNEPKDQA
jgi:hypothetical protein